MIAERPCRDTLPLDPRPLSRGHGGSGKRGDDRRPAASTGNELRLPSRPSLTEPLRSIAQVATLTAQLEEAKRTNQDWEVRVLKDDLPSANVHCLRQSPPLFFFRKGL